MNTQVELSEEGQVYFAYGFDGFDEIHGEVEVDEGIKLETVDGRDIFDKVFAWIYKNVLRSISS